MKPILSPQYCQIRLLNFTATRGEYRGFHLSATIQDRLQFLQPLAQKGLFTQIQRGLEKEGLRITPDAELAQSPHPKALGSTLTHPYITTDYSEALLEFITPVSTKLDDTLGFLSDLHRFSYQNMDQELIWPASMPCKLHGNDSIPIAQYGSSNSGTMKTVYRQGLSWRYGRIMQSIAGLHYNFSMPEQLWPALQHLQKDDPELKDLPLQDFVSEQYFALIRNFRRYSWLLLYLFGASPVVDKSFVEDREHPLEELDDDSLYLPYATSLRMSGLGYQNNVQASLKICFNTLSNYVKTLTHAINTPHERYEAMGVKVDGEYRQLNTNILQIENEYYSDIRPKRVARSGERPSQALMERGVEYIEVRCIDLNPFEGIGITKQQARFIDTFLLYCLLENSPNTPDDECRMVDENHSLIVNEGRKAGLMLQRPAGDISREAWSHELFDQLNQVAALLDAGLEQPEHQQALDHFRQCIDQPELTPSAQVLAAVKAQGSFSHFTLQQAQQQAEQLKAEPVDKARQALFSQLSESSLQQQKDMEAADHIDFDQFLADYMAKQKSGL